MKSQSRFKTSKFLCRDLCSVVLIFWSVAALLPLQAEDADFGGFSTTFSVPPFKEGESVIGTDGWEACGPLTGPAGQDPDRAPVIVTQPNNRVKTALFIPEYGIEKRCPEKLLGPVRITGVFDLEAPGGAGLVLQPIFGGRIYLEIGYRGGAAGPSSPAGIYYVIMAQPTLGFDEARKETVVPVEDLLEGESYTLVLDVDFDALTVSFKVTGKKSDGSPLETLVKDIPLPNQIDVRDRNASGIRVAGAGNIARQRVFLESVAVRTIP